MFALRAQRFARLWWSGGDVAPRIERKIGGASISALPFPHAIVDDALPRHLLDEIRDNWPGDVAMVNDMPGSYVCDPRQLLSDGTDRPAYWRNFASTHGVTIARACLVQYADWIEARYGPELDQFVVMNFSLMQTDANYRGHRYHTHHYHDPCMILTLLLYIDDDADDQPGTSVLRLVIPAGRDPAEYANWFATHRLYGADQRTWIDSETAVAATSDYKANRLFTFLDGPISYHAVKPPGPRCRGKRRVLRMHLGAPRAFCERLYGVPYLDYVDRRRGPTDDPEVAAWIARDIEEILNARRFLSLDERRAFVSARDIDLAVPPLPVH